MSVLFHGYYCDKRICQNGVVDEGDLDLPTVSADAIATFDVSICDPNYCCMPESCDQGYTFVINLYWDLEREVYYINERKCIDSSILFYCEDSMYTKVNTNSKYDMAWRDVLDDGYTFVGLTYETRYWAEMGPEDSMHLCVETAKLEASTSSGFRKDVNYRKRLPPTDFNGFITGFVSGLFFRN